MPPRLRFTPSFHISEERDPDLTAPLLGTDEEGNIDSQQTYRRDQFHRIPNPFADLPVYNNIWRIRQDVIRTIHDPYNLEQFRAPKLNTSVVRPYVDQLYELDDASLIYCLLVNRAQFLRDQAFEAHYQSVSTARALFCELVASKLLRTFDDDNPGRKGLLLLSNILIGGFQPFQNVPAALCKVSSRAAHRSQQHRNGEGRKMTALEVAIISESKLFLSMSGCQKVVQAIYVGRIVYTPTSWFDIVPDRYKYRPISVYEPKRAHVLNQYRLVVPRTRNGIEVGQFIVLLVLYMLVMTHGRPEHFTFLEGVFCTYSFGWLLDQTATILEHGWRVYTQNLWSFLDVSFGMIYLGYFILRMRGIHTGSIEVSQPALDILALAGPVLLPRLAFNIFSENILFVALRDMMAKFFVLMLLAIWSFAGFLMAMIWLGKSGEYNHTPVTVIKWMIWIWFGLDGTGIQRSIEFHWLLGPILMVTFAFLGNTLFLTILVSTLSSTFSNIMNHSTAEIQFRRAVLTFEGVKSDAIFAYQPPFNILALILLLPLKLVLTPRWFHKVDITAVRVLNAPLLLCINLYERRYLWPAPISKSLAKHPPNSWNDGFSRFQVHGDIQAVFDCKPTDIEHTNDASDQSQETSPTRAAPPEAQRPHTARSTSLTKGNDGRSRPAVRKDSVYALSGVEEHVLELLEDMGNTGVDEGVQDRLEALEASTARIEGMLQTLCGTAQTKKVEQDEDDMSGG